MNYSSTARSLFTVLQQALGRDNARLELKWMRESLNQSSISLEEMVRRRVSGEPLQYILGNQPFGPLTLLTRPPVLIPRPETEYWTMKLARCISPTSRTPLSVLDLCTGSGCIPLALCHIWPKGSVKTYGIDISSQAIQLAKDNALLCGIPMDHGRAKEENVFLPSIADIRDSTLLETLEPPFDIVTANPPYISREEYERLPPCVKNHEDSRALLGDREDSRDQIGLSFYHIIARIVSRMGFLKPDALVVLEVGDGQAGPVDRIMRREGGFRTVEIWKDPWGKDRTIVVHNGKC